MNAIQKLYSLGQSTWYDSIQRAELEDGTFGDWVKNKGIRGVTSNPTILNRAISGSNDYDADINSMAWAGLSSNDIYQNLVVEDIRSVADILRPIYEESHYQDGFVSLEVNPHFAYDVEATINEAKQLWNLINRPNLMIKIPATKPGLNAIRTCIAAGINVNVTLIFSVQRHREVIDVYLKGLEDGLAKGNDVSKVASVASIFVSRLDSAVDRRLSKMITDQPTRKNELTSYLGKAAIANSRLAYLTYQQIFKGEAFKNLKSEGAYPQKILYTSTSVKNPAYRDVQYVEALIGPDTVNSTPPLTLSQFMDHGVIDSTLTTQLKEMKATIDNIESLGIGIDEISEELEKEGVKSFIESYDQLMASIESRRMAAIAQLGGIEDLIFKQVAELQKADFPVRMEKHDSALWTTNRAERGEIKKRLGWLDAPEKSLKKVAEWAAFAKECQRDGFRKVLLLGMGGSSLAPEVFAQVFNTSINVDPEGLILTILDSTDPTQVEIAHQWADVEETLFIVSSKSGGTSEVNAFFSYFWQVATQALGDQAGKHFIAITDPGTSLEKVAKNHKFRKVFQADSNVGGRYSALIDFGMVPAALIGIDLEKFLQKANRIARKCSAISPASANPGLVLGAILGTATQHGKNKVTILTDGKLNSFGSWLEQLIAESSGKEGKGIVPIDIEPISNTEKYGQDRLFVYLRTDGSKDSLISDLRQKRHLAIQIDVTDEYDLGAQMYLWEYATAIACAVIGVNSFDQPDVQDNKTRTNNKIGYFQKNKTLEENTPLWGNSVVSIYGLQFPGFIDTLDLHEIVWAFLDQRKPGDYIAINAYLPRTNELLEQLQNLRTHILEITGCATTLGFGPRFLHSTGQLHKGGADNGLFIQITANPVLDIEIPGQNMTFGVLERAQALGDLEALQARNRRAIRIHMKKMELDKII